MDTMTQILEPHVVCGKPAKTVTIRNRTYDAALGDRAEPDGEDVVPAHRKVVLQGDEIHIEDVPEVRIPYWGMDEKIRETPPPSTCPDCRKGLSSKGTYMICEQITRTSTPYDPKGADHLDCIVACGERFE